MTIPFIPPELVGEIARHFNATSREESEIVEAIENGKSISLVCREWRQIGQGLRWRSLCISPSSFRSLLTHFASFPHLAPLLQHLAQPRNVDEGEEDEEEDTSWTVPLAVLLSLCQQLKRLDLKGNFGDNFFRIIQSASWLPRLEHFNVFIFSPSAWNDDLEKLWLNGFTSLKTLMLLADNLATARQASPTLFPCKTNVKRLVAVSLGWICPRKDQAKLAQSFFSPLDPSVLTWCSLTNSAACPAAFALLRGFLHLEYLTVDVQQEDAEEAFRSLIEHLPKLLSLEKLQVEVELVHDIIYDGVHGLYIDTPLEQVLASFPSTLLDVKIRQLAFADHEALAPLEDAPAFSRPVLQVLYSSEFFNLYPMTVWKDEFDGLWYRELDTFWSDFEDEDASDEEEDEEEEDEEENF